MRLCLDYKLDSMNYGLQNTIMSTFISTQVVYKKIIISMVVQFMIKIVVNT